MGDLRKNIFFKSAFKRAYVSSQEGIIFFVIWKNISEMIDRHLCMILVGEMMIFSYSMGSVLILVSPMLFFSSVERILCGLVMES